MAQLSDEDYRIIIGDDWKRKLNSATRVSEGASAEEKKAAQAKRAQQLADMRFTFGAIGFTGAALVCGALYTGQAWDSIQAASGLSALAVAVLGIGVTSFKRRSISAELALQG